MSLCCLAFLFSKIIAISPNCIRAYYEAGHFFLLALAFSHICHFLLWSNVCFVSGEIPFVREKNNINSSWCNKVRRQTPVKWITSNSRIFDYPRGAHKVQISHTCVYSLQTRHLSLSLFFHLCDWPISYEFHVVYSNSINTMHRNCRCRSLWAFCIRRMHHTLKKKSIKLIRLSWKCTLYALWSTK